MYLFFSCSPPRCTREFSSSPQAERSPEIYWIYNDRNERWRNELGSNLYALHPEPSKKLTFFGTDFLD